VWGHGKEEKGEEEDQLVLTPGGLLVTLVNP
jgi:hypothetical protein